MGESMNIAEKIQQTVMKQLDLVHKYEAKASMAIGKAAQARDKLWKICPHKWGIETITNQRNEKHYVCDVCGMLVPRPKDAHD